MRFKERLIDEKRDWREIELSDLMVLIIISSTVITSVIGGVRSLTLAG